MNKGRTTEKIHFRAGPACPSLLRCRPAPPPTINHTEKHCSSRDASETIFSTLVSPTKITTAGAALLSPNITCTDGATGPFLSHSLQILIHMTRTRSSQAGHLATGRTLDWRLPVSTRTHTPEPNFFTYIVFKVPPERSMARRQLVLLSGPCAALVLVAEASLSRVPVPEHGVNVAGDALRPGACPSLLCGSVICERLDPLRRSRRCEGLPASLLLWRTHPFALLRHCSVDEDSADRYLVVLGQDPAADLHSRDDQKLAWTKGIDPHPVDGGEALQARSNGAKCGTFHYARWYTSSATLCPLQVSSAA